VEQKLLLILFNISWCFDSHLKKVISKAEEQKLLLILFNISWCFDSHLKKVISEAGEQKLLLILFNISWRFDPPLVQPFLKVEKGLKYFTYFII